MAELNRISKTTITDYLKKVINAVMRNRKMWAMLNAQGNMKFNCTGAGVDEGFAWPVEFKQHELKTLGDGSTITFEPSDNYERAKLDYRGYYESDSITYLQKLKNGPGKTQIVDLAGTMLTKMGTNLKSKLGQEFYVDGNAAANTQRFHGIESFLGCSGPSSAVKIGINNDTYAGLSTALEAKGGVWTPTGKWPVGTGDSQYDYWTPLCVDVTSTVSGADYGWQAATKTWENVCLEALRWGLLKGMKNDEEGGKVTVIMLRDDSYHRVTNRLEDKTGLRIGPGNEGSSGLWKLGFGQIINFEGVDITSEYGVPATVGGIVNHGYGIPMKKVALRSLQPELIVNHDLPVDVLTERFLMTVAGNLMFESIHNVISWKEWTV